MIKILIKSSLTLIFTIGVVTACSTARLVARDPKAPVISVLTFNVENLFDTAHDRGKNDETFLPKAKKSNLALQQKCNAIEVPKWRDECLNLDWSESVLAQKIERLVKVIKSTNAGQGADVIFLQEVENLAVLERLNQALLPLKYRSVLIEGKDLRGIDVAVLTRLEVLSSKLTSIPFKDIPDLAKRKDDTRGILNVRVRAPNHTVLSLFAVHLPAPFHPHVMREQALVYLNSLAMKSAEQGETAIAAGDFNITHSEEVEKGHDILAPYVNSWQITHRIGCKRCKGSTYWAKDKTWSFLDQIWLLPAKPAAQWQMDASTVKPVQVLDEQVDVETKGPRGFEVIDGKVSGVSDHYPMCVELTASTP